MFINKFLTIMMIMLLFFLAMINVRAQNDLDIDHIIANMSQKEKIGQLLMLDFRQWTVDGKIENLTQMNSEVAKIISDYNLGGIVLFRENIANLQQSVILTDKMQKASTKIALMIAIDQEGGQVTRLKFGTSMPGNMALGANGSASLTKAVAQAIGDEILAIGINTDFAPSADINSNYKNPIIGIRSFSSDVEMVNDMTKAYIMGLQNSKVISTAKHFPGHGDTEVDSHFGLPIIDKSFDYLMTHDLMPFKTAIKSNVDMIMSAHIVVPALDESIIYLKNNKTIITPATLSKKILTNLIKKEFNYQGVIISDSLQMKAITDNFSEPETVVKALIAGVDIALMPTLIRQPKDAIKLDEIYKAINKAVNDGSLSQSKIDDSLYRILSLKKKYGLLNIDANQSIDDKITRAKEIVRSQYNFDLEKKAADLAVTLIKNENKTLPFKLENNQNVLFVTAFSPRALLMQNKLLEIIESNNLKNINSEYYVYQNNDRFSDADRQAIDKSDFIVLETTNLNNYCKYLSDLIHYANAKDKKLVLMSTSSPYDIMYLSNVKANIAVYGFSGYDQTQAGTSSLPVNITSGIDAIFGEINPTGKLPVAIYDVNNDLLYKFGHGLAYENPVNTEKLNKIIINANNFQQTSYTKETFTDLVNSVKQAQLLLNNYQGKKILVSQKEVDDAGNVILKSIDNLQVVKISNNQIFYLFKKPIVLLLFTAFVIIAPAYFLVLKKRRNAK